MLSLGVIFDIVPLIVCNAFNFTFIMVDDSTKRVVGVSRTLSLDDRLPYTFLIAHKVDDHSQDTCEIVTCRPCTIIR